MPRPLVTVVTPSYNQARYIRATIESVLSQDYPNIEYIVMDGGSTDGTAAVVKDYASRLTFISEKDRGQSHAINKGFLLARGGILSWLNSDDLYLPGAVSKAVEGLQQNPLAGAVYGEGFLIDAEGRTTSRFPYTEPFNLWKLVHVSDYILQQTVFFRKDVLDRVGHLDEDLHYAMDWDILIRVGKRHPLHYVPEYMGCLREYPEAKSFSGRARRAAEIRDMLRRHTGMGLPPGYVIYGLDAHHQLWCEHIDRCFPEPFKPIAKGLQRGVRLAVGMIIGRTIQGAQGLDPNGWASRRLRYMLPPGDGPIVIEGVVPHWAPLRAQSICIKANDCDLGRYEIPYGDFQLTLPVPDLLQGQLLRVEIKAARSIRRVHFRVTGRHRDPAYLLKSIRWANPEAGPAATSAAAYATWTG